MACTLQPDVNQEPFTHPHSVLCLKTQKMQWMTCPICWNISCVILMHTDINTG